MLSPPDVEIVYINFVIYADGELWGVPDISATTETFLSMEVRTFAGLFYAREPLRVSSRCEGEAALDTALMLEEGPNLLEISGVATLSGLGDVTLQTTDTLDLPQTPVATE